MIATTYPNIAPYGALIFSVETHHRIENDQRFSEDCNNALSRFLRRDWGDTCEEDADSNRLTICEAEAGNPGGTVMASYLSTDGTKFWILCSGFGQHKLGIDYCYTTVLFPSEY